MRRFTLLGLTLMLLLSMTATASALTVKIYTDKTLWEQAVSGQFLTEDFSDTILNPEVSYTGPASSKISNGVFHGVLQSSDLLVPTTTWLFTPQMKGYGGDWRLGGGGGSGNSLLVYVNDLSHNVGTISSSYNGGFWGFTADTLFASVLLQGASGSNQQTYQLDDMVYSQVPVPGTLWLVGGGLIGLLPRLRRLA